MQPIKKLPRNHALIPSPMEVVVFFIISALALGFLTFGKLSRYHEWGYGSIELSGYLFELQNKINESILPNLATALVWALIGLIVYFIIWLIIDTAHRAEQTNSVHHRFIYPSKDSRHLFFLTVFGQLAVRGTALLLLVIWLLLLPQVVSLLADYLYVAGTDMDFQNILLGAVSIVIFGFYIFLAAPILRLIFLRPRVFKDRPSV